MSRDTDTIGHVTSSDLEGSTLVGHGHSTSTATSTGEKVCCACGKNVAGQKRFKDGDGKYWCYDCGMQDTISKHPEKGTPCADCDQRFAPSQLQEYDGAKLCEVCVAKRRIKKKRQEARIARAAAEDREIREKQKLIIMTVVGLVLVVALVGYAFL